MLNITDLFLQTVQIDSESGEEAQMSAFVQDFLAQRDIKFTVDKLHQIYAAIPGQGDPILFSAHLDTVPPGKGIEPTVQPDGKITSSGDTILGGDDKVGVALLLWLIDYQVKQPLASRRSIEIVFTTREEISPSGAASFDMQQIKSQIGFIFDKGNTELNTVVLSAPFITEVSVTFIGKPAHAANPEAGINALAMLGNFLTAVKLGRPAPAATLNFGVINGGDATNTIPGQIKITGDFRAAKQATMAEIAQSILAAAEHTKQNFPGSEVLVHQEIYCRGYRHNESSDNVTKIRQAYQASGFSDITLLETQAGSDACVFNNSERNLEVFNLADGVYAMHSTDEYVYQQSLAKLTEIVQNLLKSF